MTTTSSFRIQRTPILLFDDECAVCRRIAHWVRHAATIGNRPSTLTVRPIGNDPAALRSLSPGLDIWKAYETIHLLMPDGTMRLGGEAVAETLRRLPRSERLARCFSLRIFGYRPFQGLLDIAYLVLADVRPLLGCESCSSSSKWVKLVSSFSVSFGKNRKRRLRPRVSTSPAPRIRRCSCSAGSMQTTPSDRATTDDDAGRAAIRPEDAAPGTDRATLTRALLELEAAQARVQANAESVYAGKRRELVVELLPVLDDVDRALDSVTANPAQATVENLVAGLRMMRNGLENVLVRYGVKRVDAIGQKFDPALHEAVATVPTADASSAGLVVGQIAAGYRIGDALLRAAKVSVGVLPEHPRWGSEVTVGRKPRRSA